MEEKNYFQTEARTKSAGEVENIVKEAFFNDDEESGYAAVNQFIDSKDVTGSPDEFHNLSVNFSRKDDYETACKILEKGLGKYSYSVDLLADFLQIGLYCNKEKECQKYYEIMLSIPKVKWTWRGFSFSIDYLQLITEDIRDEKTILENKKIMLSIVDEYEKYFPYEEDVYLARSEIFKYFNNQEKEIECLQAAIDAKIKSPKCGLRLADFYFSQGRYSKALEYIEQNKIDGIDVQNKINVGYMYYLAGLCKAAILQKERDFSNYSAIMDIYQDFYIAEETSDNISSYGKNIERQIFILETKTGIKYDDAINVQFGNEDSTTDDESNIIEDPKVVSKKKSLFLNLVKRKRKKVIEGAS